MSKDKKKEKSTKEKIQSTYQQEKEPTKKQETANIFNKKKG